VNIDPQRMELVDRYLALVKLCITRLAFIDEEPPVEIGGGRADRAAREIGKEWPPPAHAETMVGLKRLDNVQACVTDALVRGVPGDFIEAGSWRGGVTLLMRAALAAWGDTSRLVWVADSFQGVPRADTEHYPLDAGLEFISEITELTVSVDDVKRTFARYGLLDDQVRFLPGWFKDTLPSAPIEQVAVMRIDGDLYESTLDALTALYPKLSPGGWVIVDDYHDIPACRRAVSDYRVNHGITEPIATVDWTAVCWQRS